MRSGSDLIVWVALSGFPIGLFLLSTYGTALWSNTARVLSGERSFAAAAKQAGVWPRVEALTPEPVQEEEVRYYDGKRGWRRRGWVVHERRLLDVAERRVFETSADLCVLLPESLDDGFATSDLAAVLNIRLRLAQQMAYCLRECGALTPVGKHGNSILYARTTGA